MSWPCDALEVYIHIPFCLRKCRYCDFVSYPGHLGDMSEYVTLLLMEMEKRLPLISPYPVRTVYLGGGTPSLLPAAELTRLIRGLSERLDFSAVREFTAEANPGTIQESWLQAARASGVNRISMGAQSFEPGMLRMLGRIHTPQETAEAVDRVRKAGIQKLSLDLMFGLPGQTVDIWRNTLEKAISLHPEHLSCYGLIPEEGTPLKRDLDAHVLNLPEEDTEREMYDLTIRLLESRGFHQYEISNFALPGCECIHNIGYWRQIPYLGLGCSAASMLPGTSSEPAYVRSVNPAGFDAYRQWVLSHEIQSGVEPVSRKDAQFETLMLGLRMNAGVSESDFLSMHGCTLSSCCGSVLRNLEQEGLMERRGDSVCLTRNGMDLQNAVLVRLMECF